jgi:hypothetical protein
MLLIQTRYEDRRLKMLIEKVNNNEKLRAIEYANRSTYVNPSKLRIGSLEKQDKFVSKIDFSSYCPV